MAENFLQSAARMLGGAIGGQDSWLGKLFNKKKPVNTSVPPPTYSFNQPPPKTPIGMDDPEITRLMGGITDAQGVLARPAPKLQEAKPDPLEQILSVVLGGLNPHAAGKTLQVPLDLAQGRADTANKQAMGQFNLDRETAEGTVNANSKLIDMRLDRDGITERVNGMLRKSQLDGLARLEVEKLKTNKDMIKVLANLEATGGTTVPAVTAIYLQMGYSQDEAEAIAEQVVRAAPSLRMQIAQSKQETDAYKAQETERNNHRKVILAPNSTFDSRLNSIMALGDMGDPRYAAMSMSEMIDAAEKIGAQTAKMEAETDLTEAKTEYQKALKNYLPEKMAADLAHKLASADHLRNLDNMASSKFDFEQSKEARKQALDAYKSSLTSLSSQYGSLTNEINSLRTSRREWEKKLAELGPRTPENAKQYDEIQHEIDAYGRSVKGKIDQMDGIRDTADEIRRKMSEIPGGERTENPGTERTEPPALKGQIGAKGTVTNPAKPLSKKAQKKLPNRGYNPVSPTLPKGIG
jgi:Arc/MetJ family transcription regulator